MKYREANLGRFAVGVTLALLISTSVQANQINDQVTALSESQRQTIFSRMMQREGEKCQSVSRTLFQGTSMDGAAFWNVSCAGGKDWQIMIKNTAQGDIKMLDCATLKALGGGTCFSTFKRK
jgi:hypothetical protein